MTSFFPRAFSGKSGVDQLHPTMLCCLHQGDLSKVVLEGLLLCIKNLKISNPSDPKSCKFLSLKHDINWNKITLHGLLTFPSAPRRLQNTSEEPRRRQKVVKKFVACLVPIVKVEEGVHLIQDYQ